MQTTRPENDGATCLPASCIRAYPRSNWCPSYLRWRDKSSRSKCCDGFPGFGRQSHHRRSQELERGQSSLFPSTPRSFTMNTASSTRICNTTNFCRFASHSFSVSCSIRERRELSAATSLRCILSNTALTFGSSCSASRRVPMLYSVL